MANKDVKITLSATDNTRGAFSSAQKGMQGLSRDAEKFRSQIKSAFGQLGLAVGSGYAVKSLAAMADEFSNLQARLKLASRDQNEFNAANEDLVRIAQSATSPLAETATLYTRIAASVKDLDVSQRDVAATTEAVALALRISGASAAESSSAMLQFSQSIAKGKLDSEEFNTVAEAAPRLLQALAASLKVPVGELKEMSKAGQLTRDVLINGLLNELPKLRDEAATLPKTIGAAFTDLQNKLLLTIGEFDKLTGATGGFASAINSIGTTGLQALAVLGANVTFVFKGIGTEIGGIAAQLSRLAVGDFKGFASIGKMMKEDATQARRELDAFEKRVLGGRVGASAANGAAPRGNARIVPPPAKEPKTRKGAADPLASLLSSTDIGKLAAFDKQVALLNARFDGGRKSTELYNQAMTKLVESTFAANFTEFNAQLAEQDETQRLVAEHLKATNDAIYEQQQAWADAGAALEDEMRTPLENANIEFARLQELLDRGAISWETFTRATFKAAEALDEPAKKVEEMDVFAKKAAENMQSAFADFLFDPFDKGMDGMLKSFGQTVQRMIAEAASAQIMKSLFGDLVSGGEGSGFAGDALKLVGSFFADGGIAAHGKPVSLPRFAGGGVSNSAAIFGEAGPEAAVPLPDGRSIPVTMKGGGGHTVNVYVSGNNNAPDVRRAAAQGAREALGLLNGARRYA